MKTVVQILTTTEGMLCLEQRDFFSSFQKFAAQKCKNAKTLEKQFKRFQQKAKKYVVV